MARCQICALGPQGRAQDLACLGPAPSMIQSAARSPRSGGSPAEYGAGLALAITRGWYWKYESGT